MKVCFSRSRSSFSSTFFLHTHSQSFKTLISFPTLIQKNTPGGTNFERKNHPPFLHYWLTFRMESGKLIGFSMIKLLISFRKIWNVNKCFILSMDWEPCYLTCFCHFNVVCSSIASFVSYFVNSIYVFHSMNCEIIWKKPRAILRYIHI